MSAAVGLLVLLSVNPLGFNTGAVAVTAPNPAQLDSFEWHAILSPQHADESFGVTIFAKDENGDNYDYDGPAFLSTSLGAYVQPAVVQFNNGVCDTNIIVTLADSQSLQCLAGAASGTSNVFEVLPGLPNRLVAILPGEQLAPGVSGGRSGQPDNQTAGDTFSFQVYVTDSCFNRIWVRSDSVYFGSDDGFAQLPSGGKLSYGLGSFAGSLRTAGQRHIFTRPALSSSLRADTSSAVKVTPGVFENMLLLVPGETLTPGDASPPDSMPGKVGTPYTQYLQVPFTVTVLACDRCWNPVTGPGNTVYLQSGGPDSCSPAAAELRDSVRFSFQFNRRGDNCPIWVRDSVARTQSYVTYLDVRARGTTLEVVDSLTPDTVRSGETAQVVVRVRDANGDPIQTALVQTSVTKGSGRMLEPALLTDTLGFTTAHFLCTPSPASEQDSIRVSSGDADTVFGIYVSHLSDSLFAFPNPFGSINVDQTQIFYHLQRSSTVTITIYDSFGNEVWTRHFEQNGPGGQTGDNIVPWDGTNNKGQLVASGIYLIQVLGTLHTGIDFRSLYRVGVVW